MAAITVRLDNMAHGGEAMGRHEGNPILVPLGVPGELVRVVVDEKRRAALKARRELKLGADAAKPAFAG